MPLFFYLCHLISILIYSAALGACFLAYGGTERNDLQYAGIMMFIRICDAVFVLTEDLLHFKYAAHPLVLTAALALTLVKIYLLGKIVYTIFKKEVAAEFYILLCLTVIIHGLLSTYPTELYWNLEPITFNTSVLIICGTYWSFWVQASDGACRRAAARYKRMIQIMMILSALALLYIVANLFLMKTVLSLRAVELYTNCFYLSLAGWYLVLCRREFQTCAAAERREVLQECCQEIGLLEPESGGAAPERLAAFCRQYELTGRESEILGLILSGRSNQEISEMLYITVGTVKAHVHSVFGKLDVSRRGQVITRFLDYQEGEEIF